MPYFLLRNMNRKLRHRLEADAKKANESLAETVRGILCEHYLIDCSEIEGAIRRDVWNASLTVLLKLQPELFQAIKDDSAESEESMRSLIIGALETHYQTPVT